VLRTDNWRIVWLSQLAPYPLPLYRVRLHPLERLPLLPSLFPVRPMSRQPHYILYASTITASISVLAQDVKFIRNLCVFQSEAHQRGHATHWPTAHFLSTALTGTHEQATLTRCPAILVRTGADACSWIRCTRNWNGAYSFDLTVSL
jgi:hypothetical protein